jgi:phosphatidate cytidylyltransferase
VEGSLGGLLAGALGDVLLNWVTWLRIDVGQVIGLALLLPLAALLGDLGESLVKRGAHVKDASAMVPGHGGFLDRLDSILFTVPLVYYYAIWVAL